MILEKTRRGTQCALPMDVEEKLALFCRYMASCNLAIDRTQLNISAVKLSASCGIRDFKASKSWIKDFMMRHELSQRLCQPWEHARQAHTNKTLINEFFNVLKIAITRCEESSNETMTAGDIFNLDETGFDRNIAKNRMVIVRKHAGRVRSLSSGSGAHVTMVNCISAAGIALKPYFIMKGEIKPKKGTKGVNSNGNLDVGNNIECPFCMQTSAYVDDENWTKTITPWIIEEMRNLLPENSRETKWQVLVLDGCVSHTMTFQALQLFQSARILIVGMPSHTSADLQPLDVSVFKSVKGATSQFY
jgi:DDE superfamily endonuclease/Tc5 transposase DNA-binding domain